MPSEPMTPAPDPDAPRCAYGHMTRRVGCVSCVLVFDRPAEWFAAQKAKPDPDARAADVAATPPDPIAAIQERRLHLYHGKPLPDVAQMYRDIDTLLARVEQYQQAFACCGVHRPDLWEGDGTCVICEAVEQNRHLAAREEALKILENDMRAETDCWREMAKRLAFGGLIRFIDGWADRLAALLSQASSR